MIGGYYYWPLKIFSLNINWCESKKILLVSIQLKQLF